MKPFKQFLDEMSIAAHGDWKGVGSFFSTLSIPVMKNWKQVGSIGDLEIRQLVNGDKISYVVGFFTEIESKTRLRVIIRMELDRDKETESLFKQYKHIYTVTGVITDLEYRGQGFRKALYQHIVNKDKLSLLGDSTQYFGARKLWSSISSQSTIIVDLLDIANGDIIEKNIKLKHGDLDHEFDPRLWSRDIDKVFIRPIMTRIT